MAGDRNEIHALLAALRNPLRREILRQMADKKPVSPRELTDRLDQSLSNVSYHVRVLANLGAIEPAVEKQVGGATQHFYRWAIKARWAKRVLMECDKKPPGKKKK